MGEDRLRFVTMVRVYIKTLFYALRGDCLYTLDQVAELADSLTGGAKR